MALFGMIWLLSSMLKESAKWNCGANSFEKAALTQIASEKGKEHQTQLNYLPSKIFKTENR